MAVEKRESEVKTWLNIILQKENFKNLHVNILETSDCGDGYLSDIMFAQASRTCDDGLKKIYNRVLKCNKQSEILQDDARLKDSFINEIYIYDKLFPILREFQESRDVDHPFDTIPKCYGTLKQHKVEVIALENLKSNGYELWPRKEPFTRNHIDLDKYQGIVNVLKQNLKTIAKKGVGMSNIIKTCIEDASDLLKDDLDQVTLSKWKILSGQIPAVFKEVLNGQGMKMIVHGDCWSNNFMYKYDDEDKIIPTNVAILDWQVPRPASLICDLSYFLFSCISDSNVNSIEDILSDYYKYFSVHLAKLQIDPNALYPYNQFLDEWKKYSKFGILHASMVLRITSVDDTVDLVDGVSQGKSLVESFITEMKDADKITFKTRMHSIMKYVVKNKLI